MEKAKNRYHIAFPVAIGVFPVTPDPIVVNLSQKKKPGSAKPDREEDLEKLAYQLKLVVTTLL